MYYYLDIQRSGKVCLEHMIKNFHAIDLTMRTHFAKVMDEDRYQFIMLECLKCAMPLAAAGGSKLLLPAFDEENIQLIATPMENAKSVKTEKSRCCIFKAQREGQGQGQGWQERSRKGN